MSAWRVFTLPVNSSTGRPRARIRSASALTRRSTCPATSASRRGVRKSSSRASRWWTTCMHFSTTQAMRRKRRCSPTPLAMRNSSRRSAGRATASATRYP